MRLSGWAAPEERAIAELVLADRQGRILGPVLYGSSRGDIAERLGEELRYVGFFAYVHSQDTETPPVVWVRYWDDTRYVQLAALGSFPGRWAESRSESLVLSDAALSR